VAIKVLSMENFRDPYMLRTLESEISVMRELSSPHIVKLFDVMKTPAATIMAIELCESDLEHYIEKNGSQSGLQEPVAIAVLVQLMQGFKCLVDHGYIHRDIKPANALLKAGVHKVADFGFATKADISGNIRLKDCCGSPMYEAPQLLEGNPYTAKSDIWSIGVLFYEMLFGIGRT